MEGLLNTGGDLEKVLKDFFGYSSFRGEQEAIIKTILSGQDCFVLMPTGAGKSLCYQLPSLLVDGVVLVISPLIALMKNQTDQMNARGIPARFLNSTLTKSAADKVREEALNGELRQLYIAPETLTRQKNVDFLRQLKIAFVAVDEVHCVSDWGHDFRPEYRKIRPLIEQLGGKLPVLALTATATIKVQHDIQKNLGLEKAKIYKTSFFRNNLHYQVMPKTNAKKNLVKFIKAQKEKIGIVYCLSRKKSHEIADFLSMNGFKAKPYHAGLDNDIRQKTQEQFLDDEIEVIVATIAFGMGIDKPNVRFVVHYDAPKSLEGYYQETGRAGRDGRKASCLMFYSYKDIIKLEKFNKEKSPEDREKAKILLDEVSGFAESAHCRSRDLLQYFGEHKEDNCGNCGNCVDPPEQFDAKEPLQHLLKEVLISTPKKTVRNLVKVIKDHDTLAYSSHFWASLVRQAILRDFIHKDDDTGEVYLSQSGTDFMDYPHEIMMFKDREFPVTTDEDADNMMEEEFLDVQEGLLEELKKLRLKVAKDKGVPAYVVFQDESLEEMASSLPLSIEDLTHVNGVGGGKARKFGASFIKLISKYTEEHGLTSSADVFVKTSVNKSKVKIKIIQGVDDKVDLEELSQALNLDFEALIEEMEHIIHSGTKLDINYFLEEYMDEDSIDDVYDYFMSVSSDDFSLAQEELGEEYADEEIKLVHIKFISEVAN